MHELEGFAVDCSHAYFEAWAFWRVDDAADLEAEHFAGEDAVFTDGVCAAVFIGESGTEREVADFGACGSKSISGVSASNSTMVRWSDGLNSGWSHEYECSCLTIDVACLISNSHYTRNLWLAHGIDEFASD